MSRSHKAIFLRLFITTDEKKAKTVPAVGKAMVSEFCVARGIIFIDYLEKWKTLNGKYYANLLQRLCINIQKRCPHFAKTKVLFHYENAPVHASVIAMAKISELKSALLPRTPYSPDITPSDRFLFLKMALW